MGSHIFWFEMTGDGENGRGVEYQKILVLCLPRNKYLFGTCCVTSFRLGAIAVVVNDS